jgi:hypothetical protein
LGKGQQHLNALQTPVGQEMLRELQSRWGMLLEKVVNKEATEEERIEYIVVNGMLQTYSKKIAAYYGLLDEVKVKMETA